MNKNYRLVTLYSGSRGNATFFSAKGTSILIDAGKSATALKAALRSIGSSIEEISAVFVTHEHSDHTSALDIIAKRSPRPIHIMDASAALYDRHPESCLHNALIRHTTLFSEKVGELTVKAFRTSHDSRMSVGYRIEFEDGGRTVSVGVATDMGYVTDEVIEGLSGCEAVVLEANHDVEMLMEGSYPYELKKRILSRKGHLSNADSAILAQTLANRGTKGFILAHLSEENNRPEIAYDEISSVLADMDVTLAVAAPDSPVELA